MNSPCTLALDIGGTKIAYALVPDSAPLTSIGNGRVLTKAGEGPLAQTRTALELGISKASELGLSVSRVGIGAPGVVKAPAGDIIYNGDTITGWAGSDLRGLSDQITGVPLAAHNDVRIWAYGEHHMGAGKELGGRVLYVSLGTGVGGAIVDQGKLIESPTGTAGEFAEIVCADFEGRAKRCENIASGTGLSTYYNQVAGTQFSLHEVMERWYAGEETARAVIDGNLKGFGRALGALVTVLDLSGVIIGGGVAGIGAPITDALSKGIMETALVPNRGVHVGTTTLGPDAAVIAAAQYARDFAY